MNRSRIALGAMFLGALGIQLTHRDLFARLVPPYLDTYRDQAVVTTQSMLGVAGVSMLIPRLRPVARWAAMGVLLPSLPEAVNQVRQPERMREAGVPPQVAIARVPVQAAVIAWVWRATRRG